MHHTAAHHNDGGNISKIGGISVMVNGTAVKFPDQKPVVQNERILVPVRFVAEALGHKVSWDSDTNSVNIDGGKIVLYIGAYSRPVRSART